MKANELPEKIYIDTPNHGFWYRTKDKSSTEYIRTDVFIEKAYEWLLENTLSELCLDLGNVQLVREFTDNFKDAMKGE